MTVYTGSLGTVEVDSNVVAQVKQFSLSETADALDQTALGDAGYSYKGGLGKTSGSIECLYDHGDATGQEVMTVGAEVTLVLHPIDDASTYREASIAAVITDVGTESAYDQILMRSFSFTGGPATWSTTA